MRICPKENAKSSGTIDWNLKLCVNRSKEFVSMPIEFSFFLLFKKVVFYHPLTFLFVES